MPTTEMNQELIQKMKANSVPQVDTSCITSEVIDNIIDIPSLECSLALVLVLAL